MSESVRVRVCVCVYMFVYMLISSPSPCLSSDVNECEVYRLDQGGKLCIHECVNVPGSYHCACPTGYKLLLDGRSCEGKGSVTVQRRRNAMTTQTLQRSLEPRFGSASGFRERTNRSPSLLLCLDARVQFSGCECRPLHWLQKGSTRMKRVRKSPCVASTGNHN